MSATLIERLTREATEAVLRRAEVGRTAPAIFDAGAVLLDNRSFDVADEFHDAPEGVVRAAAAVSIGSEHLLIHHCRAGTVNFRALALSMARLLTGALLPLTGEQMDAAYDHLAEHYRELGIEPPEPGCMDEDFAYELALEGRLAHLDDEGNGWVFVEPVEAEGRMLAGFVSVDGAELKLCVPPEFGPLADYRNWGTSFAD